MALGGRKGSSRRRGRRGCGCLVRVGVTDIMPGIVELPTLEDLKVEEVRLVREAGKRGIWLKFPGPGPSPALIQRTLGPGPLTPKPPTQTGQPPERPFLSSGSRHSSPLWLENSPPSPTATCFLTVSYSGYFLLSTSQGHFTYFMSLNTQTSLRSKYATPAAHRQGKERGIIGAECIRMEVETRRKRR